MPEPTGIEQNEQIHTKPNTPTVSQSTKESDQAKSLNTFIGVCSVAIIGCFFLPWIRFLLGTPSGYELQQLPSDRAKLVWFIPGAALLPLLALAGKQGVAATAAIAGATPFVALAYYLAQFGADLFKALQIGGYATLLLGAILCVLAGLLSKTKP